MKRSTYKNWCTADVTLMYVVLTLWCALAYDSTPLRNLSDSVFFLPALGTTGIALAVAVIIGIGSARGREGQFSCEDARRNIDNALLLLPAEQTTKFDALDMQTVRHLTLDVMSPAPGVHGINCQACWDYLLQLEEERHR